MALRFPAPSTVERSQLRWIPWKAFKRKSTRNSKSRMFRVNMREFGSLHLRSATPVKSEITYLNTFETLEFNSFDEAHLFSGMKKNKNKKIIIEKPVTRQKPRKLEVYCKRIDLVRPNSVQSYNGRNSPVKEKARYIRKKEVIIPKIDIK